MNRETIITAVVTFIVATFDLLKIWGVYVPIESDTVYTIVSLIVAAVIYWRNQSWTKAGWTGTLVGRRIKADARQGDLTFSDKIDHALKGDEEHDN